jgi:hypothetical protein
MTTDKERLDFLEAQEFTRWVGYTHLKHGHLTKVTWPVFPEDNLRDSIDHAINCRKNEIGRIDRRRAKQKDK